jgi:hypothetical protein
VQKIVVFGLFVCVESVGLPITVIHVTDHLYSCVEAPVGCSICSANRLGIVAIEQKHLT